MKLKLTIFLAFSIFLSACSDSEVTGDKTDDTKTETTTNDEVKIDKDNIEITGENGEKVEIKDGKVKVTDGDKEINISKDGLSTKNVDKEEEKEEPTDKDDGKLAEKLTLKGMNETKTIACEGRRILINGMGNNYTFTGECSALLINGSGQKITAEKVGRIRVNGTGNKVFYTEGSDGKDPSIKDAGTGNSISKK